MRRGNSALLAGLAGSWALAIIGILLIADDGFVGKRHIEALQKGLFGAIEGLERTNAESQGRMQQLYKLNWMEKIMGKDTTHDLDYIKSLPAGDVGTAGYEGFPQIKGVLPSDKELASAQALLKQAIDTNTMPSGIGKVWDGKPYEPDADFNQKISNALAGFNMALGEKKWDKMVTANCNKGTVECKEITEGKHEGYHTKWDGKEWQQFDGEKWNKLEHDSVLP